MSTALTAPLRRPHRTRARRIVVGVDGTPDGWQALAWAGDEAATTRAHLTICRAGPPPPGSTVMSTINALELDDPVFARSIHRVRQRLGGERVSLRFAPGDPAVAFCSAARAADLLVIGAGTPAAARVLADADGPVVAVRPVEDGARGPFAGQVVVAVAGASIDPLALEFAFGYAATHRVPLVAVHVSSRPPGDFWFDERTLETHFAVEPSALAVLGATVEPMLPRYPAVAVRLGVLAGDPVRRLLDAARGARLTVVGRRHRRLGVRLLGSVSRRVVARADGPVAVIPALPTA